MQEVVAERKFAVYRMRKAPFRSRNHAALAMRAIADGKHIARIVGSSHRILRPAKMGAHNVAQRHFIRDLSWSEIVSQQARNMLSIVFIRHRSVEPQIARSVSHIPLPTQRGKSKTLAKQPRVTNILNALWIGLAAIHQRKNSLSSA